MRSTLNGGRPLFHSPKTSRRSVMLGSILAGGVLVPAIRSGLAQTPEAARQQHIAIDISNAPVTLDPALARSVFDWSVIHSMHDSILNLGDDGSLQPLAAESFTQLDSRTFEVVLREGLTYHDGTPVLAEAIDRAVRHVQGSEGPAAGNFGVIDRVEIDGDRVARIVTSEPAPWLPSQLAVWLVLYPEGAETTFETAPVGCGPFRFVSQEPGLSIALERNPDYVADSPKGVALADLVTFRFVSEPATRIADLSTGTANIIDGVGQDQASGVSSAGGEMVESPVLGVSFLRMVNDIPPLDDPRVRQAINHAIDVETIAQSLVSSASHRIASLYPDNRAIGFDPDLQPFTYDPDRARSLLTEAGVESLELQLEFTGGGRDDVMEAITAYLAEVGITVTVVTTELATFNGTWQDPASAELRFVTWRPVYDPHTLLGLMFSSNGPLARFNDPDADALIAAAAQETDSDSRASLYQDLGRHFQQSPPAVFLWNLAASYGVKGIEGDWVPRGDEYVIATGRIGEA